MTVLDSLLNQKVDVSAIEDARISDETLKQLAADVEELRAAALRGEKHSKEDMRKIVAYFRARRSDSFRANPPKKKAPPRKTKKQLEIEAAQAILDKL